MPSTSSPLPWSTELTIVTPTYPPHFVYAADFVRSAQRNLKGPSRVPLLLVVGATAERPALQHTLNIQGAGPHHARILSLWDTSACGNAAEGADAQIRAAHSAVLQQQGGPPLLRERLVLQSAKKLLGALCAETRQVLMIDSESLVVQRCHLERLARRLATMPRRPVLFDAVSLPGRANVGHQTRTAALRTAEGLLGIDTRGRFYGYSFGYFWLYPTAALRAFVARVRSRHGSLWSGLEWVQRQPTFADPSGKEAAAPLFVTMALYAFLLHGSPDAARRYEAVDAQTLLASYVPQWLGAHTEHLWGWLQHPHSLPQLVALYANLSSWWPAWRVMPDDDPLATSKCYGKCGASPVSVHLELVRRSPGLCLATSAQSPSYVDLAMGCESQARTRVLGGNQSTRLPG